MKVWKIRDKRTGKFMGYFSGSTGERTWTTLAGVKHHLQRNAEIGDCYAEHPENYEVVTFEVTSKKLEAFPVQRVFDEMSTKGKVQRLDPVAKKLGPPRP